MSPVNVFPAFPRVAVADPPIVSTFVPVAVVPLISPLTVVGPEPLMASVFVPRPSAPPNVRVPVPEFENVLAALSVIGVEMIFAALFPLGTNTPAPVVLPSESPVPPEIVIATLSSNVMLFAACVVFTVIVPVAPLVPAATNKLSALVGVVTVGAMLPAASVDQNTLVPQVPVAAPEPAVAPFVSQ